jgi:tripartite-type tricarboxylate transporter receptor subunit TctC
MKNSCDHRLLAQQLSKVLSQPVRVVGATGANTAVGASEIRAQPWDGYAAFWDIISRLAYVLASKELPYNADDFQAVGTMAVIARTNDKRCRTVTTLVLNAKASGHGRQWRPRIDGNALDDLGAAARI